MSSPDYTVVPEVTNAILISAVTETSQTNDTGLGISDVLRLNQSILESNQSNKASAENGQSGLLFSESMKLDMSMLESNQSTNLTVDNQTHVESVENQTVSVIKIAEQSPEEKLQSQKVSVNTRKEPAVFLYSSQELNFRPTQNVLESRQTFRLPVQPNFLLPDQTMTGISVTVS